jgi:hypothetical protein
VISEMVEMIGDLLSGRDGFFGILMGLLLVVLLLALLALFGWMIFSLADTVGQDKQHGTGAIIKREFVASHCDTTLVNVGNNMTMPQTTCYDDEWRIHVRKDDSRETDSTSVSRGFYDGAAIGDRVKITYRTGRFSGGFYLSSIDGKLTITP